MKGFVLENIKLIKKNGNLIVLGNQNGKITLFWNEIDDSKINLIIEENTIIDILEIDEKENSEFNVNIKNNSSVHYNVFTSNSAYQSKRTFYLDENAFLRAGYADFSKGKKVVDIQVNLNGIYSNVEWHLASLSQNEDKKIFNVNFEHNNQLTFAKMENYGVCKDKSTLGFLGDAVIYKNCKKSSTNQSAKIMVFDKECHAIASPKLCIYENDVQASHGASEGQINPEHIFYLTSRGIPEEDAKRLITLGYLNPIIKYFKDEAIQNKIRDCIIEEV